MRKATIITIALVFAIMGLGFASAVLLQNVWMGLVSAAAGVFILYGLHTRIVRKRKPQYPLVPPEGRSDWYLPATNIPRPVIEDYRKIEEKKRRFARTRRMVCRAVKPKRK